MVLAQQWPALLLIFVDDPRFTEQEAESQVCARRISAGAKFFRIK